MCRQCHLQSSKYALSVTIAFLFRIAPRGSIGNADRQPHDIKPWVTARHVERYATLGPDCKYTILVRVMSWIFQSKPFQVRRTLSAVQKLYRRTTGRHPSFMPIDKAANRIAASFFSKSQGYDSIADPPLLGYLGRSPA